MTREETKHKMHEVINQRIKEAEKTCEDIYDAGEWGGSKAIEALVDYLGAITCGISCQRLIEICNEERERMGYYNDATTGN